MSIIIFLVVVVGVFVGVLYFTDTLYLLNAVRILIPQKKLVVGIHDFKRHPTRVIPAGTHLPWELSPAYNQVPLSPEALQKHAELETTAFLIIKEGKILTEQYFLDTQPEDYSGVWSVTKTYIALCLIFAIEDGLISSEDALVTDYLPEWPHTQTPPLTLRHLACMSAGLAWDEKDHRPISPVSKLNFYGDVERFTIRDLEIGRPPGEQQHYNSGATQLLGTILGRVLGETTISAYISEKLWKPLGCKLDAHFVLDSKAKGKERVFGGMVSMARDISRLGQLLLQEGVWQGKRILSDEQMRLLKHIPYTNETYSFGLLTGEHEGERFYFQSGYKGQYVITVPSHGLVITRLGHNSTKKANPEEVSKDVFRYIKEAIEVVEASAKAS